MGTAYVVYVFKHDRQVVTEASVHLQGRDGGAVRRCFRSIRLEKESSLNSYEALLDRSPIDL